MSKRFKNRVPISIGYNCKSNDFSYPFHSHDKYEIYYFQAGKCNYLIGDRIYVMKPGDLIIMHGMTLHRPNVDPNAEYIRSIIHFDPSYVQGLFNYPNALNILKPFQELKNVRMQLSKEHQSEMECFFELLTQYRMQQNDIGYNRFLITFMDMMVYIYGIFENKMKEQSDHPTAKIQNAQNIILYIEQNYMNDFHMSHLEEYLHLNKYYLSKIFKDVTGTTIFAYLLQRRINEAKILFLMENNKSVTEVCYQVGFKHPAHFSRVFKQQLNQTAEQYRKKAIENTTES